MTLFIDLWEMATCLLVVNICKLRTSCIFLNMLFQSPSFEYTRACLLESSKCHVGPFIDVSGTQKLV